MPRGPQWFALRTRSRHEKRVEMQLTEQGICAFLPLQTESHRWSDRHKVVEVPLFPGYVFVQVVQSAETRLTLLRTTGVAALVGIHGEGLPIPDKQIDDIRTLLENGVPLSPRTFLNVGQRVRIRGGSLDGVEGLLLARNADRSLVVSVELIRRSLEVRMAGYEVEIM